ncbi:hypothetical protein ACJX0J_040380, partial [Zea mays]
TVLTEARKPYTTIVYYYIFQLLHRVEKDTEKYFVSIGRDQRYRGGITLYGHDNSFMFYKTLLFLFHAEFKFFLFLIGIYHFDHELLLSLWICLYFCFKHTNRYVIFVGNNFGQGQERNFILIKWMALALQVLLIVRDSIGRDQRYRGGVLRGKSIFITSYGRDNSFMFYKTLFLQTLNSECFFKKIPIAESFSIWKRIAFLIGIYHFDHELLLSLSICLYFYFKHTNRYNYTFIAYLWASICCR